ncbi:hypothetical protein BDA96_10G356500 [Sorghum bicolor]|uniref:DNA-binding protein RHL1 n=3 Tax=Sorghum bicolor TaxID=4558 RepID=A0A921Q696_SORBI|nr:DNA-binding protein RHL1 isoform X3 [Sorghum bicolor]KAG0516374.1 hypothetical protein BDA96_10G356500 [Sorghum bicolor]KXG20977.1 hypothetical protein SORBI_3010G277900 [Sorghum bicolor]|eukprot:XP_002437645.2 DNA-binding protein RHL1 isoform X3 [Sorghum bicolor]
MQRKSLPLCKLFYYYKYYNYWSCSSSYETLATRKTLVRVRDGDEDAVPFLQRRRRVSRFPWPCRPVRLASLRSSQSQPQPRIQPTVAPTSAPISSSSSVSPIRESPAQTQLLTPPKTLHRRGRMVKKASAAAPPDAEADERRRLRSLAFSNGLLQRGDPAAPRAPLAPSPAVTRLQGRDVVRRGGQRKSRYLFSFPGLLAPAASGGRVGELADLGTKNPVLYLEFPQGRMKLFGTHVYPKNKYLTLQMTRSAKGVVCEDVFESLIVFSEAWWVGTKEDNPEELKLEFPKEFQNDGTAADCDFKGGAGGTIDEATGSKAGKEIAEPHSPKFASDDDDASEDSDHKDVNNTQTMSGTPVRQSARNAGKMLKRYTDLSSGGDSSDNDNETAEVPEDLDDKEMVSPEIKDESESEDVKPADSSTVALSSKEPLVQATLSSMFKKAEEKKRSTRSPKGSPATKGAAAKKQRASLMAKQSAGVKKASGTRGKKKPKVEEDEIEELSSSSQDNGTDDDDDDDDDSDEDWAE